MATKRPALKDYHVNLKMDVSVAVRVSAATPEDALVKGREIENRPGDLLSVDEFLNGTVEVTGLWTVD